MIFEHDKRYQLGMGSEFATIITLIKETEEYVQFIDLKGDEVIVPKKNIKRIKILKTEVMK